MRIRQAISWPNVRSLNESEVVVAVAEKLRALSRQVEPPYSIPLLVAEAAPDVVITGRDLPPGIEEIVTVTDDGPLIIYRRGLSTAERRYAIAHALAHLLFDQDSDGVQAGQPFDAMREQRADAFALELLAPHRLLAPRIVYWPSEAGEDREVYMDQVDQIAAQFHVPSAQIDQRIRELERQTKL